MKFGSAAALIGGLTLLSRLAGFGRILVFTWAVGAGPLGDVYQAVNTVPNIVFEIVAGGALASLVVPVIAAPLAAGDRERVAATAGALLTWVLALLVPVAVVVAFAAGPIVSLVASGADPTERALGVNMLRIFAPQLPLYGAGIVLTGLLQAHRRFAWPVIAPLLSSITVSGAYLAFAAVAGRAPGVDAVGPGGLTVLAGGTTLAVAVLTLCLVVPVRRLGVGLRPGFALGEVAGPVRRLAVAGAVTVGTQQAGLALVVVLAYGGPPGSVVLYNLAQTMFLLPWAVLAVPVATSAFPELAQRHATGDRAGFGRVTARALRAVLLAGAFGSAVLISVAPDAAVVLASLSRERPEPTALSAAMIAFAPGLVGYGLFALLSRVLYARQAPGAAAAATAVGWAVAAGAALALAFGLPVADRVAALAGGNTVGMLVLGVLLLAAVYRAAGRDALDGAPRAFAAGIAGAAVGVGLAFAARTVVEPNGSVPGAIAHGTVGALLATAGFLAVAYLLDRRDLGPPAAGLLRRVRRTRPAEPAPADAP
ncbi:membrane protein [Virgisporangium aliadipatigenens]|uniref:Membrane protein n=1 Tax=Virgisporangium aliadipatigenens TaxID=741659 RepID=A0A8J3YUK0_9ACTN|nr:lipid II flippase MurJ [Virgisporangium aliadipatigenens]GIJ51959.1 membrane protein [Virgisporangium aliadipatigenens]